MGVFDETNLSCYSKYKLWDNCFIFCDEYQDDICIQSIPTWMVKIKQLHAVMDLETFLWLSEDDKMMECPVWCQGPQGGDWWLEILETRGQTTLIQGTRDTPPGQTLFMF